MHAALHDAFVPACVRFKNTPHKAVGRDTGRWPQDGQLTQRHVAFSLVHKQTHGLVCERLNMVSESKGTWNGQ